MSQFINYNNTGYYKFSVENIKDKIKLYTCDLDKIIPWDKSNLIFSGGLLCDILTNRKESLNTLSDIDLFLYGSTESKLDSFRQIILNLDSNKYEYLVGINKSVIYIFVQSIPRIIQLIFTNKNTPEEIIDTFDLTHLQSFWNGKDFYSKNITFEQISTKKTLQNYKTKPSRLIKYLQRGIDVDDLLYLDYDFIIDSKQFFELDKHYKQHEYYKNSSNLTILNSKKVKLDEFVANLSSLFWCKIIKNKNDIWKENFIFPDINNPNNPNNPNNAYNANNGLVNYFHFDIDGEFEPKSYELDIYDDTIELKKKFNFGMSRLFFQTQRNIYIQCQIIKKCNDNNITFIVEITKPRVIDYLLGLLEDLEQDIFNYANPLGKNNYIYKYTHPFRNSTSYPKIKPDSDFVFNTFGLILEFGVEQSDYDKYLSQDNLYILFGISIYLQDKYRNDDIFGFKLKPKRIDRVNLQKKNNFDIVDKINDLEIK